LKRILVFGMLWCCGLAICAADDPPPAASPTPTPTPTPTPAAAARPRAVPVGDAHAKPTGDASSAGGANSAGEANAAAQAKPASGDDAAPVKFSSSDQWMLAGYNDEEVIYTIIVSNDDTRVIRCTTLMQGWYYEKGKEKGQKLPISDRQSTTLFPNKPARVGNWMDMDKASGATYSVKCRAA